MLNHSSRYSELTDDQFLIIGKIVIEWANIEILLSIILARLLHTPDFLARTYTDNMNAAKLQDSITEAIDIHSDRYQGKLIPDSTINQIKSVNSKIAKIRSTRNKFAHFCWARVSDKEIFGTNFSGGSNNTKKSKRSSISFSTDELSSFYRNAYDITEELTSIIQNDLKEADEAIVAKSIHKR